MPHKSPLPTVVVKREEKEKRLNEFITHQLAVVAGDDRRGEPAQVLLLARSAESPVVRALMAAMADMHGTPITIRAIFTMLGTVETAGLAEACGCPTISLEVRWARDVRLSAAHEQLVLGPAASYIGDCMRRDPGKRDGWEQFFADCGESARLAMRSFERLWLASEPVFERPRRALVAAETSAAQAAIPPPADDQAIDAPTSRH